MQKDEERKEQLLHKVEEIKVYYDISNKIGFRAYIRCCPSNMAVCLTDYIQK